ncbi:hypothetical protein ACP4OV_021019 [Aristida adscensionis]
MAGACLKQPTPAGLRHHRLPPTQLDRQAKLLSRVSRSWLLLMAFAVAAAAVEGKGWEELIRMPAAEENVGTTWAVLVAGSNGFENYRHKADMCHTYQILRKGGLKEENIVVFMYDDMAYNTQNPGKDVYHGVPKLVNKDYTGDQVTTNNFYVVLMGNRSALTGGSRKVIDSKPNDHIFIFYSDHGVLEF